MRVSEISVLSFNLVLIVLRSSSTCFLIVSRVSLNYLTPKFCRNYCVFSKLDRVFYICSLASFRFDLTISAENIIVFTLGSQRILAFDCIHFALYRLYSEFISFSVKVDLCEFVIILFVNLLCLFLLHLEVRIDISGTLSYKSFELFYGLFYFIEIFFDSFVASFTDGASAIEDVVHGTERI